MKSDIVSFEERIIYSDDEIQPSPNILHWISKNLSGSSKVYISSHEIAAGATNEPIAIDDDSNTKLTFFWDTAGVGSNSLSIKTNGASTARAVMPRRVVSGRVTSLTVSNIGSSALDLGIARIVISDSTNVTLIEESI